MSEKDHPASKPKLVVALGASAGGLESFQRFFSKMPNDSGNAFILIPHLSRSSPSMLTEILSKETNMKVNEAEDGRLVKKNQVYVIQPGQRLTIKSGILQSELSPKDQTKWNAIEHFLISLAKDQRERAVAIILSGSGNHGILGIREIKSNNGLVIVQSPATTQHHQMPDNAINTGLVDFILAPEKMHQAINDFAELSNLQISDSPTENVAEQMQQTLVLLRSRVKHDFSNYRKNMLLRRIRRRMLVCRTHTLEEYNQFLSKRKEEASALCHDLLIGVTAFFRDAEAFHILEQRIIPELVAKSESCNPVRVWVPACASGEEAYSLAILFIEEFNRRKKNINLQIFASDIDERSLKSARRGVYPSNISVDINQDRLSQFFNRGADESYRVNKLLRDSVVFASQNLICDAPFSRLDLISCRNFLIYLQSTLQSKVIDLFHFSLRKGGYLMLGPSESIGRKEGLFETVSKKWRIYQYIHQPYQLPIDIPATSNKTLTNLTDLTPLKSFPRNTNSKLKELVDNQLLSEFAPASVLINQNYEVLNFQGPTNDYLEFPKGTPSNDITVLVRNGIRARLRNAVHTALKEDRIVVDSKSRVKRQSHYTSCTLTVRPIKTPNYQQRLVLITFEETHGTAQNNKNLLNVNSTSSDTLEDSNGIIQQLESELDATRDALQGNIEELKASNEEIMSMNEELQSANEELETSKEELQSSNEELITVNSELQNKLEELEKSNDDVSNLLSSTDIATIFLNREFKIMLFNPSTAKLLNLRKSDIGRPIVDFSARIANNHLIEDATKVLEELSPSERDVWSNLDDENNLCYLRRMVPYRTQDNRIDGVVITFVEITKRYLKKQEMEKLIATRTQKLKAQEERLNSIMKYASEAIIVVNLEGIITDFNQSAENMFHYTNAEIIGEEIQLILSPAFQAKTDKHLPPTKLSAQDLHSLQKINISGIRKDGTEFPLELTLNHVKNLNIYVIIIKDITEKRLLHKAITDISTQSQEKIGAELHDGLGQRLTGISLLFGDLNRKLTLNSESEKVALTEITKQLSEAITETRNISHGLAPIALTPRGLQDALTVLTNNANSAEIHCRFLDRSQVQIEDRTIAIQIYRIAQEAVNNALKYANAKNIEVILEKSNSKLQLVIRDDGQGFNIKEVTTHNGIGLLIMNYRADSIGAELTIDSTIGQGTIIRCYFCVNHILPNIVELNNSP